MYRKKLLNSLWKSRKWLPFRRCSADEEADALLDFNAVQRGDAEMENRLNRWVEGGEERGVCYSRHHLIWGVRRHTYYDTCTTVPVLWEFEGRGTVRTMFFASTLCESLTSSPISTAAIIEMMIWSFLKGIWGRMSLAGPGSRPINTTSTELTSSSFVLVAYIMIRDMIKTR